jgi:protein-S-isoprenylcysteine O-methyltransferase Ste14
LAAVLLYAVVDVGPLGPLPNMYDPTWSALKTWSAVAQALAALAAMILLVVGVREPATRREDEALQRAGSEALGR